MQTASAEVAENLLISSALKVHPYAILNSRGRARPQLRAALADHTQVKNRTIDKFSTAGQGTLYPIKLFGIIELVRALLWSSTAACLLYDECGDMIAPSF
jgi:hypothetical protein